MDADVRFPCKTNSGERNRETAPVSAWFALSVFVLAVVFGFVDRQVISLLAEPIRHALNLSDTQIGLVQGLGFTIFSTTLIYPLGVMADRYDRRLVLSLCVIVWSLGTAVCGLARSFSELLLATTAIAAGETGLLPIIFSALPDIFPYRQRVLANKINYLAGSIGAALGLGFGGGAIGALNSYQWLLPTALRSWETWRLTFFVVALPAPLIVFAIALLHLPRARCVPRPNEAVPADIWQYVRSQRLTMTLIFSSVGMYYFAFDAGFTWLPVVLVRLFGVSPANAGIALGLLLAVSTVAGVAIAGWTMRFYLPKYGKAAPLRICVIVMLFGLAFSPLMLLAKTDVEIIVLYGILAVGGVTAGALIPNLIQDLAPPNLRARISAIYGMIVGLIAGASGMIVGIISDHLHNEPKALLLSIVIVSTPGWLAAWWLMRQAVEPFSRTLADLSVTEEQASVAQTAGRDTRMAVPG
jgi:MFS family permease